MEALSDSTVMRLCSALTVSPGLTSNSMTATSAKSPMSGTWMSMSAMFCCPRGLEQDTAEIRQDLSQEGIEACRRSAVDHAMVPGQ